jgi:uncharacterized protein with von Willebrand factor type A (vWA) domain
MTTSIPPTDDQETGYILHNLMLFGEVLRRLGLDFGSSNMLDLVRAIQDIPIGRRPDFQQAARCLLVHRKPDLPVFDEAFQAFWRRPARGTSTRDLRSLGEERRYRTPQVVPPPGSDSAAEGAGSLDPEAQPAIYLSRTYSATEVLREKDFADFTPAEITQAQGMMAALSWDPGRRRTRRKTPGNGAMLDLRATLRRNLKYGGEWLELARRRPKDQPRPLVLICDISGSMERYTRMLLHFIHTIAGEAQRPEAFLFATRLTRITRYLSHRNVNQTVTEVSRAVPDWAGGTRIGEVIKTFNFHWARRVLRSHAVVLIISDGWDRGEPELLSREMARLRRSCRRLIWLNPLLGSPSYEPLTQGMQAALPYVDDFMPVHNLNSLTTLAQHLNQLDRHPAAPSRFNPLAIISPQAETETPISSPPDRRNINPALNSTFRHPLWGQNTP